MKILIVSETLYEGGTELFVLRLARKLIQMGIDTHVLNMNSVHENKEITSLFNEVPIIRLSLPFISIIEKIDRFLLKLKIDFSFKYYFQSIQLKKKIIGQYDIIHTNYIQIDYLVARLKTKEHSFKQIVTLHGDYLDHYNREKDGIGRLWFDLKSKLNLIQKKVDHFVVITDHQKDFLINTLKWDNQNITKIYNGYEPIIHEASRSSIINNDAFVIGMISRGIKEKGWQILIDAFLKMPNDCQLILVGSGTYLDKLRSNYKDNDRIHFTGFQNNPLGWIRKFDVFVLPTYYSAESLPTVIIEALYAGKPVIATDIGEIKKMLQVSNSNELAGYLLDYNYHNSVNQLVNYLKSLYQNKDGLSRKKEIALEAFNKFNMNDCAGNYIKVYKQLLS